MMMSDATLRISVVINRELDPDVYQLLTSINSSKSRSEFARILMRGGASREIKARRTISTKSKSGESAGNATPSKPAQTPEAIRAQERQNRETGQPSPTRPPATHPQDDDFVNAFVTGIQGVPKR
jgi:hypothetical protein